MNADSLWVITGSNPCCWALPFYAVQRREEVEIWSAVPLLRIQKSAVESRILVAGRHYNGLYRIPMHELKKIAHTRADGTDPETLLVWERPREVHFEHADRNAFLDALHLTGIGTRSECEIWWRAICDLALDWFINKEGTIDLGFIKLHVCPYRIAWMDRTRQTLKRRNKLENYLVRTSPFIFRNDSTIETHIEVEHSKTWFRIQNHVEQERLAMLGKDYVDYILGTARRRLPLSIRLYQEWLAHRMAPSLWYDHCGLAWLKRRQKIGRATQFDRARAIAASRLAVARRRQKRQRGTGFRTYWRLRKMSAVQQTPKDVRNGGRDLDQPKDETNGTVRMLVPPSSGSVDAKELLAQPGDPGRAGLAG